MKKKPNIPPQVASLIKWHNEVVSKELKGERKPGVRYYDEIELHNFEQRYIYGSEDIRKYNPEDEE